MAPAGDTWLASLPGQPAGSQIDIYVEAIDGPGHVTTLPATAPSEVFSILITESIYTSNCEDPADPSWRLGTGGDDATSGVWVRVDPTGTFEEGIPVQPENDHTPAPGTKCFVTGNAPLGGGLGENDVDRGCTTLISPTFDLSGAERAFLRFSWWFAEGRYFPDDTLQVDVSGDNGASWYPLQRVADASSSWVAAVVALEEATPLTSQMRIRVRACDSGIQGIVEAGIDDFSIEAFYPLGGVAELETLPRLGLQLSCWPNPTGTRIQIQFRLDSPGVGALEVLDVTGRRVRRLRAGELEPGLHSSVWDGSDRNGDPVPAGLYLVRLVHGRRSETDRVVWVR